jgi:hypothetical protein
MNEVKMTKRSFFTFIWLGLFLLFLIGENYASARDKNEKKQGSQMGLQGMNKKPNRSTVIYVPYIYYYPYYVNPVGMPINNYQTIYNNTNTPSISFSHPKGEWTETSNGAVPQYAIVYQDTEQYRIYYCRVEYDERMIYGFLIENDGCYINDKNGNKLRFNEYEVLRE